MLEFSLSLKYNNNLMPNGIEKDPESKTGDPKVGRFDVWVDTTPLDEQCTKLRIELQNIRTEITPWNPKLEVPSGSYQVEVSDGSDTVGKSWEKAMKGMGKDQRPATIFEGLGIVRKAPEIFGSRRLAFPASAHDTAEILQITKKDGKFTIKPLFVADSNIDHETTQKVMRDGKMVEELKEPTDLPFALVFATKEQAQAKTA